MPQKAFFFNYVFYSNNNSPLFVNKYVFVLTIILSNNSVVFGAFNIHIQLESNL